MVDLFMYRQFDDKKKESTEEIAAEEDVEVDDTVAKLKNAVDGEENKEEEDDVFNNYE